MTLAELLKTNEEEKTIETKTDEVQKAITKNKKKQKKFKLPPDVYADSGKNTKPKITMKKVDYLKKAANVPAFLPKYEEYRLSDIVSTTKWREDNISAQSDCYNKIYYYKKDGTLEIIYELDKRAKETLEDYIYRLFPNSIASQYLQKTKCTNRINLLSGIVDQYAATHKLKTPADDVMVMHFRVGDVIDQTEVPVDEFLNRRINSYYALFKKHPDGWPPVYVRCLASLDKALMKTKELGFHKISFVYGFHIKDSIKKSKQYLAGLMHYAQLEGFKVEMITHADADVSFAYACNAKHFIPGGGGFSKLMSKVVKHKGNSVYYVRV
jgi:hypothetical protein